jgi:Secretion system C-terminal sorting domain
LILGKIKSIFAITKFHAMKKCILLFLFIGTAKINIAQTYQPFPTDSTVWRQISQQVFIPSIYVWDYNYYLEGDTLLLGETYQKLYRVGAYSTYYNSGGAGYPFNLYTGPSADNRGYVGGIREDGAKRIYFLKTPNFAGDPDSLEQLLYDFNLNVGDILPAAYNNTVFGALGQNYVSSIDSILIGTTYHKRFNVSTSSSTNYVSFIEGVGSTVGLLEVLSPPFEFYDNLMCFTRNGVVRYSNILSSFPGVAVGLTCELPSLVGVSEQTEASPISVFPNPTTENITIQTPFSEKTNIEIVDVFGRLMYQKEFSGSEITIQVNQFPKGVYFLKATAGNKISSTQKIILQ